MNYTKVYTALSAPDDIGLVTYADHARIVAEKDAYIERMLGVMRELDECQEAQQALLAKYQRLHAADVGYDEPEVTPAQRSAVEHGAPSHDARGNLILRTEAEGEEMLRNGYFDPR